MCVYEYVYLWHDGWHSFLWVWMWVPVRGSRCLFWRETHTKGLRAGFPTRLEEQEERQGPRKKESRTEQSRTEQGRELNRVVDRTGQSAGEWSWQKSGVANGHGKATTWTCGPRGRVGQCKRMSQRSWWFCGNFVRIPARDSSQMHRKVCKNVTNFSLLALRANPSPCLFVLFSSTRSAVYVVFCVSVKKCEIPLAGYERNH